MGKNIVVLSGSPRKDGNTVRLTEAFIEGAKAAGKEISLFMVAGLHIGGCRGADIASSIRASASSRMTCRPYSTRSVKLMRWY